MTELSHSYYFSVLQSKLHHVTKHPYHFASFIAIWYYVELLYMMSIAVFMYPPMLIAIVAIVTGIALSFHIIKLYSGNDFSCSLQLLLMDIHIAFSIGTIATLLLSNVGWYILLFTLIRAIVALCEVVCVYAMTNNKT